MEFQEELGYDGSEDPGPWREKMQRVQQIHGYDDENLLLLAHLCLKGQALAWFRSCKPCTLPKLYAGLYSQFLRNSEKCATCFVSQAKPTHTKKSSKAHKCQNVDAVLDDPKTLSNVDCNLVIAAAAANPNKNPIARKFSVTGGDGILKYPPGSFVIDCSDGDISVGDVLIFQQKLYNNALKEGIGIPLNTRTVAGRVEQESDSSIIIAVLWSKGMKAVSTKHPFVVSKHSLQLLKPRRQYWGNERNRKQVLEEKWKRSEELELQKKIQTATNKKGHYIAFNTEEIY